MVKASSRVQPPDVMREARNARLVIRKQEGRILSAIGHGYTRNLFTGTLLTQDGKPAVNPRIHYMAGNGKESDQGFTVNYDAESGRFYFFCLCRANYSLGPYPHTVEETPVVIHA